MLHIATETRYVVHECINVLLIDHCTKCEQNQTILHRYITTGTHNLRNYCNYYLHLAHSQMNVHLQYVVPDEYNTLEPNQPIIL